MKNLIIYTVFILFGTLHLNSQIDCTTSLDETLDDGTLASNLSTDFFTNKRILLLGELIIDQNTVISNCHFTMGSSSCKILVDAGDYLEIYGSHFGCFPWIGIECATGSFIIAENSIFEKFQTAISLQEPFGYIFSGNMFNSDLTGNGISITNAASQLPVLTPLYGIQLIIANTFTSCDRGIDLLTSTTDVSDDNEFNLCNIGIFSEQSTLSVYNSFFNSCISGISAFHSRIYCVGENDPLQFNFNNCLHAVNAFFGTYTKIETCNFKDCYNGISNNNAGQIIAVGNDYVYNYNDPFALSSFITSFDCDVEAINNVINSTLDLFSIVGTKIMI